MAENRLTVLPRGGRLPFFRSICTGFQVLNFGNNNLQIHVGTRCLFPVTEEKHFSLDSISGDAAMQCIHVIFFLLLQFPYNMLDGGNRVIPNHSRPRPAHHFAHSFFHLRAIAVDGTLLASWLVLAKPAAFEPCSSVL